ncbi:hypothetical protein BCV70DRAFT_23099 [Testicularia cyperi]|uniref:DUF803-domain-containing protein n=1 Tax=Testicularia cyperi TaxID=1882483 RepID=A0A317XZR8_9BASI|nr:hypothetical protein BCV70DRAFT_23099 [Testicularia cyperi]
MAQEPGAPFTVATAIILGLVASFIQSLGLTIQRKSHLLNESLPTTRRKTEWRRPLWLIGFLIFLVANIGGTVFQIGALPIVMLAPLGAVSLLYNAVLARFLLNDLLSRYMVIGTALIATGAVLIGYFGVVPSPPHNLDELLDLYARPTFVAFATIFTFLFLGVLAISHLTEWQLHSSSQKPSFHARPSKPKHRMPGSRNRLRRRWSAPTLAPVAEVSENSSGIATPVLTGEDEHTRLASHLSPQQLATVLGRTVVSASPVSPSSASSPLNGHGTPAASTPKRNYGSLGRSNSIATANRRKKPTLDVPRLELREDEQRMDAETVRATKLGLAVAYGGASGTLSGACLLLAKSGVELLMLSFAGHNQFGRWQSWFLIGVLLAAALLQLWYLNKALKLADPTLVCPLAFCFYNTSSIALGLVYFDQIGALAWYDILLVALGTAVLLSGVWVVSLHGHGDDTCMHGETAEHQPLLMTPGFGANNTQSPTDADDYEGLLVANGAGITGPHLPPAAVSPHSSTFLEHNPSPLASPEEATLALPLVGSPTLERRASSSSEAGTTMTPGDGSPSKRRPSAGSRSKSHHQRRPTITLDFPLRDDLLSPSIPPAESGSEDVEASAPPPGQARPTSPEVPDHQLQRRHPSLYNTILEHGLSIGISPSSPGFYLQPRSPSLQSNPPR